MGSYLPTGVLVRSKLRNFPALQARLIRQALVCSRARTRLPHPFGRAENFFVSYEIFSSPISSQSLPSIVREIILGVSVSQGFIASSPLAK